MFSLETAFNFLTGVEEAFSATSKVLTVSFHKMSPGFYPGIYRIILLILISGRSILVLYIVWLVSRHIFRMFCEMGTFSINLSFKFCTSPEIVSICQPCIAIYAG